MRQPKYEKKIIKRSQKGTIVRRVALWAEWSIALACSDRGWSAHTPPRRTHRRRDGKEKPPRSHSEVGV